MQPEQQAGIDPHRRLTVVLLRLREVRPEMKVLYVSGGSREAVEGKLLKMKASAFLQKPFEGDTLLMTVRKALQSDF